MSVKKYGWYPQVWYPTGLHRDGWQFAHQYAGGTTQYAVAFDDTAREIMLAALTYDALRKKPVDK
jgi:hypothetical protein